MTMTPATVRNIVINVANSHNIATAPMYKGGYLPEDIGYAAGADLDGKEARRFLESAGFTVVDSGDAGRYGYALTRCGIHLSTNGWCSPRNQ